ncbi:MAG TPA: tetratricopeptide repeat protein [Caldithrix abyssi]|uniref:Tetratricopeptide repeat protein n=1 Tax=Caldithrix abyssi TaxID=187145 RepID=A0A7V4U0R8_CALAY|nr:tetratricopeptide repeat protein [Caldithrix abyssi]
MKFKVFIISLLILSSLFGQDKRRIGLIPLENKGNSKYDWVSYGLEYLLVNKFSVLSIFYIPENSIFKKALKESGYGSRPLDERMVYHIGKNAEVEVIISGSYQVSGNTLNVTVHFSNTFNGATILENHYSQPLNELFDIANKIVYDMINLAGNGISASEKRLLDFKITSSIKAYESFVRGYMENGKPRPRPEVVIGLFRKAIREDARFWEAYYNLGITYFNDHKYNDALRQFNKVIQALPDFEKPYYGRGLIYERQKKYDLAIADFKKVTEFNSNDYKSFYYLGKISVRKKQYKEAAKYLKKANTINPDYAPAYYEMGNIYYNQGKYRQAIPHFRKATELDADNANYHRKLGDSYYRSQVFFSAYNELKTTIRLRPNDAIAHFLLGITVYKQAVLEELINSFLDLLSNNSNREAVKEKKFNKKEAALDPVKQRKVYEEMADAFAKAAQARPGFMEATFNLALTYHEMGDLDRAEKYYKATLQIKPDLVRAYLKLGELYTEEGKKEEAIDQYRKIFYIEPALIVDKPTLGAEHQYINIYQKFRKELEEKLQANPNNPKNNLVLAKIYQAQGQYGKAANVLRKVLSHSPNNREAKTMLSRLQN